MQAPHARLFAVFVSVLVLAACGRGVDDPYARLKDPPLVQATLHAIILASDSPGVEGLITGAGFVAADLPPNYQRADAVQATIWGVPEPVAAGIRLYRSSTPGVADLQLLRMSLAARGRTADAALDQSFFRHVLGTEVPAWPLPGAPDDNTRVQVWTYRVPSVVDASKRLRENGIPVVFDPVGLTTSYLGDHRTLAIRAPDGTVVQLVETAAQ